MAPRNQLDLDAVVGFDDTPVHTRPFKLLGRTWTMVCDLNTFAISDLTTGEPAAIVRFFDSIVVPDERLAFRQALAAQPNLTPEKLGAILSALVEAAGERPTTPASDSPRGVQKRQSPRKSVVSSSGPRAVN